MKLFRAQSHSLHLVKASLLPALIALSVCLLAFGLINSFADNDFDWKTGSMLAALHIILLSWFAVILGETGEGYHTKRVVKGLSWGMLLFILSEVMSPFALFWGFFHYSLSPALAIGMIWPPLNTQVLDVWGLPLVNTVLPLTSGVTVTLAHANMLRSNYSGFLINLVWTIVLAVFFPTGQFIEYKPGVKFSWRENIYGSVFLITTGFHGLHVTIGTFMLAFCLLRQTIFNSHANHIEVLVSPYGWFAYNLSERLRTRKDNHQRFWHDLGDLVKTGRRQTLKYFTYSAMTSRQHFGFEASAWYWHSVDVVRLFPFTTIYRWGTPY